MELRTVRLTPEGECSWPLMKRPPLGDVGETLDVAADVGVAGVGVIDGVTPVVAVVCDDRVLEGAGVTNDVEENMGGGVFEEV